MSQEKMNPWVPRGSKTGEFAQAVLYGEDEAGRRQQYLRPLHFDVDFSDPTIPNEALEAELQNTVNNYNQSLVEYNGRLSAAIVGDIANASMGLHALLRNDYDHAPAMVGGNAIRLGDMPHPPVVEQCIDTIYGFLLATTKDPRLQSDEYHYTRLKSTILHVRIRELCEEAVRRQASIPPMSERVFTYIPPGPALFSFEEQQAVLNDDPRLSKREVADRFRVSQNVVEDTRLSTTYNSRALVAALFAGSHAIETKYPGISNYEATRLLLRNADVIGAQSWHKRQYAPFFYDGEQVAGGGRHDFGELIRRATVDTPMTLDAADRLQLELPYRSWGMCPLAYNYNVPPEVTYGVGALNATISDMYNIELPNAPEGTLTLSTQLAVNGTVLGGQFMAGRSHEHIAAYYGQ